MLIRLVGRLVEWYYKLHLAEVLIYGENIIGRFIDVG